MKQQQKQQPLDVRAPASDRSARIIQRAVEIMKVGHYGWSWAVQKAREEIEQGK